MYVYVNQFWVGVAVGFILGVAFVITIAITNYRRTKDGEEE